MPPVRLFCLIFKREKTMKKNIRENLKTDTIAALATPSGEGGIAVIRISGAEAFSLARRIYRGRAERFGHYRIHYGHIADPFDGTLIDEALFMAMKAPRSYTCEDVIEIQCHGGMIPVNRTLECLCRMGARLATPGEFTKRAFLNGRIDLIQAEAVMDIIRAKSETNFQMAYRQFSGKVSRQLSDFREKILSLIARVEAPLEYPEEDLFSFSADDVLSALEEIAAAAARMYEACGSGRIYRSGVSVALAGKPNVGKSSLMNLLLGEQRAIVTEVPGTTRDSIEENLLVEDILVNLCDTAGLRETEDKVERIGVEKTRQMLVRADFVVFIVDGSKEPDEEDAMVFRMIRDAGKEFITVLNKSDREGVSPSLFSRFGDAVRLSALTGQGKNAFTAALARRIRFVFKADSSNLFLASMRHREAFVLILDCLERALETVRSGFPADICLIDLRKALHHLSVLCGETFDEDILDKIFSEFCVGK